MRWALLLSLLVLAACGDDGGSIDGRSDGGADAGPPDAGPPPVCDLSQESEEAQLADPCPEGLVCGCDTSVACTEFPCEPCAAEGFCVRAFPGIYRFDEVRVTMPSGDLFGEDWDVDSPPDPIVQINVGTLLARTLEATDDAAPIFTDPFDVNLGEDVTLRVLVSEADPVGDDFAFDCTIRLTEARIRQRELSCARDGGAFFARLRPFR
jgi:hypothetical protein